MTKEEIRQAIDEGRVVAIEGEHLSRVCYDLFGNIVVASLSAEYTIRKLTDEDISRAILLNK